MSEIKLTEREKSEIKAYNELYPVEEIADSPLKLAEARGYLNCLNSMFPALTKFCDAEKTMILLALATFIRKEV